MAGFLQMTDAEFVVWSGQFASKIATDFASLGITTAQATNYGTLNTAWADAYAMAADPGTRTRAKVDAKNLARQNAKDNARELARIIQAYPSVTNAQRLDLGLPTRGTIPSPINAPTDAPVPEIVSIVGRVVTMNLRALGTDGRAKPAGVDSAAVWTFVGDAPPADISEWEYQGATTKITNFILTFPSTVAAGAQVWLVAQWKNPREMTGPASSPISLNLGGGVSATEAA